MDKDLIESSFAMQYGIRLRNERDISWAEFYRLLAGIMPETPLGQVVAIRAEKNTERIRRFTKYEKKLHIEWKKFCADKMRKQSEPDNWEERISVLQGVLVRIFG